MIDTRSGMSAVGDIDEFMKFQMGQSMEKASENHSDGSGNGISIGAGIGMGFIMPQMIKQAIDNQENDSVKSDGDSLSKLKILKELLDSNAISEDEFKAAKRRILNKL